MHYAVNNEADGLNIMIRLEWSGSYLFCGGLIGIPYTGITIFGADILLVGVLLI